MRLQRLIVAVATIVVPFTSRAQGESFDIVTYRAPAGWKKQVTDYAVSFSTVDNATGSWCQVGIYKSVQSSGNATADFSNEWKALVKGDTYAGAVEPAATGAIDGGWAKNFGASTFKWQGKDAMIMLLNVSGYGKMVSVLISTNSNKYDPDVEGVIRSLQFQIPATQPAVNAQPQAVVTQSTTQTIIQPSTPSTTQASTTSAPIAIKDAPGVSGITLSTTNFDDGWIAQPKLDYVEVKKGALTVLLHYAIQIDDKLRSMDNMAAALWDVMIVPRYKPGNVRVFQNEPYTYLKTYFVEGDAIDLATNKPCYVALRVLVGSGIARPIEIVAPSQAVFQNEFQSQEKIESMMNYNKFAVSPADIVGKWGESSSTAVNMYYSSTGGYAGMNASAMANSFEFRSDGSYHSNHKGAYGMVGSMTTYDQKYDGKYTMTTWDVTMTNRFKGATDAFWCQYEAVRGGRVLHLTQKNASAMTYGLVRVE